MPLYKKFPSTIAVGNIAENKYNGSYDLKNVLKVYQFVGVLLYRKVII